MKISEIKEKINSFFKACLKKADIKPDVNIFEVGYVNSLFAMQLILYIEKEFDIAVDNQDIGSEDFQTVNGICNYIHNKIIEQ